MDLSKRIRWHISALLFEHSCCFKRATANTLGVASPWTEYRLYLKNIDDSTFLLARTYSIIDIGIDLPLVDCHNIFSVQWKSHRMEFLTSYYFSFREMDQKGYIFFFFSPWTIFNYSTLLGLLNKVRQQKQCGVECSKLCVVICCESTRQSIYGRSIALLCA